MHEKTVIEETCSEDRAQLQDVQAALSRATVVPSQTYLVAPTGERLPLPEPLFKILRHAAAMLLRGERITLAPVAKELSTQEAADLLGVSRPHFVSLLDAGKIPFSKTGRHRRVRFGDVNIYRNERDAERRRRLHDLVRRTEEMGLYDIDEFEITASR